jgi:copper chaperone CopZ
MKTILRSSELSCPSCIAKIEKSLKSLDGVTDAKVYFTTGRIEVEHNPDQVSADVLAKTIRAAGYNATVSAF